MEKNRLYTKENPYYEFEENNRERYEQFKQDILAVCEKHNVIFATGYEGVSGCDKAFKFAFLDTFVDNPPDLKDMFHWGYKNSYYVEDLLRERHARVILNKENEDTAILKKAKKN